MLPPRLLLFVLVQQIQVQADKLQMFTNVINGMEDIKQGSTLTLTCIEKLAGADNLTIEWRIPPYTIVKEELGKRHSIRTFRNETHLTSTMTLTNTTIDDAGFYSCRFVEETAGKCERNRYVYVSVGIFDESIDIHMIAVPVILIGFFAIATAIGIKVHLEKKNIVDNELSKLLNGNSKRNDTTRVPMEYRTEIPSVDEKCWEFPGKRPKLELGSGRVFKPEAVRNKDSGEVVTTSVAVEMIQPTTKSHQQAALEALIRDLHTMIYLGSHLKVANLFGVSTKTNNVREEILILMNIFRHGNFKSYLIKHRDKRIHQLNGISNIMLAGNESSAETNPHARQSATIDLKESSLSGAGNDSQFQPDNDDDKEPKPKQMSKNGEDSNAPLNQTIKTSELKIARGTEFLSNKKSSERRLGRPISRSRRRQSGQFRNGQAKKELLRSPDKGGGNLVSSRQKKLREMSLALP